MGKLRQFWPGFLITLLGLPLITPLLRWSSVPCTHDGHLHYHRVAAMKYAWENGIYFSRWLPDLAFGYGYPFFVFRELPPLYAVLFPHLLGLPLPAASNLFYALTILACGWFMFLWVRDVLGDPAALVSAVAYMAAPYTLIDSLIRGNSPEALALPLLPLLLWAGRRWLVNGRFAPFLISTLTLALLSLSHNISLLIFTPTLLVYLLAIGLHHRLPWRPLLGRLILLFGLGLGMTIAYTGGALLEMDAVTLQQSTTTRNNDFRFNFASPAEILAPIPPEDPLLINPPLNIRLGWVPVGLALLGVLMVGMAKREFKINDSRFKRLSSILNPQSSPTVQLHTWLMLAGTAVYLFMALPISQWLWEALPLIDFVQFPWRFVGRAALPIAFLAGLPFTQTPSLIINHQSSPINDQRLKRKARSRITDYGLPITAVLAITLLLIEALPGLYPNICHEEPYPTINTVHGYEQFTGLVGVDPEGSYFPRTVGRRPNSSPLLTAYLTGQTPARFDTTALPANTTIASLDDQPLRAAITLTTPEPFTARYFSFAFPGWVAAINGRSVPITPSSPDGLITFPVPAGTHTITIQWQSTPLRTALLGLSLLALAATAVTAFILYDRQQSAVVGSRLSAKQPPHTDYRLLALVALFILSLKIGFIDRTANPLRRVAPPPVDTPLAIQAGEIRVDGYNLNRTSVAAGDVFDIDMAWTAVSAPTAAYQSNVWLLGSDGLIWSDKGTARPRLHEEPAPTTGWLPTQWGWDSREVRVLPGTPPGIYDIVLILFDLDTRQPRTLLAPDGTRLGPEAIIGQITVTLPDTPPNFTPQYPLDTAVPNANLRLLGFNQDRVDTAPGDSVLLTLFWEKTGAELPTTLPIHLVDDSGSTIHSWLIDTFAATAWQTGDRLRGQYALRLPATLASGSYRFHLGDDLRLETINVAAPDRLFTQPAADTAVSIPFTTTGSTAIATLTGYTIANLPSQISVDLIWQATGETAVPYHVFIHLINDNGDILAQSDGQPAGWRRPTTGWTPGEYIIDSHTLTLPTDLPDGLLRLRTGLYNPATGERLLTPTGDSVVLPLP